MATYKYKDFIFDFTVYKKNELDKFIKYLESNYSFFCMLLPHKISFIDNKRKDYTYVKNPLLFINKYIEMYKDSDVIKSLKEKDYILTYLYRDYLFYELDKRNCFKKWIDDEDSNFITSLMAYLKYDDVNSIRSILLNSKYSKEKMLNEIKDEVRIPLFNIVLKLTNDAIDYRFNNLYDIFIPIMDELSKKHQLDNLKFDYNLEEHNLTKLNYDELNNLYIEFLKRIDPSLVWLKEYNRCCLDNKIIIRENTDDQYNNKSGVDLENIYLNLTGTVLDFSILSHEFAHHMSELKMDDLDTYKDNLIREFPSFYFENLSNDLLKEKGISDDEIEKIKSIRKKYLVIVYKKIYDLIKFSYMYKCKGNLSLEEITNTFKNSYNYDLSKEVIDRAIDTISSSVISTGTDLLQIICYIMGDYLSSKFDSNDLDVMKYITEELVLLKYEDIIDISNNKDNNRVYVKQ